MRRWARLVTVGVGAAAAVAIGLAAAGASDTPGGPVGDRVPAPPDAAPARHAAAAATAPGAVIATGDGVVVEAVPSGASGAGAADAVRLTLQHGPFRVGALPIVVWVDGRAIGRARPNPDLATATAVVLDRSWLHAGATVAWSYGDAGPPTTAGTIGTVQG
jgi:hypothetical protein